jgi:hypothetical protein
MLIFLNQRWKYFLHRIKISFMTFGFEIENPTQGDFWKKDIDFFFFFKYWWEAEMVSDIGEFKAQMLSSGLWLCLFLSSVFSLSLQIQILARWLVAGSEPMGLSASSLADNLEKLFLRSLNQDLMAVIGSCAHSPLRGLLWPGEVHTWMVVSLEMNGRFLISLKKEFRGRCTEQFYFGGTRIGIQSFALAKQVLYCLCHASSPFCSGYFGD